MVQESLFWADQIANQILSRKKFNYTKDPVPRFRKYVVKTSASLSGVLHIGRLSDTVRGESVFRALKDAGARSEFIWVAENMDPMRKIPKGVPRKYSGYIGMPVTDIPDPYGCHKNYADHYTAKYFEVLDEFVQTRMTKYSMRQEYRKGTFRPYIKKIIGNVEKVMEIQNKYRSNPLPEGWSPWQPVCENCGKIMTTRVSKFEDGKAHYRCEDYSFASEKAKGCGHQGVDDPMKGNGKLVWKSEWAMQWAHWNVCSEGAGKEYHVPTSAWWVNAEIAEHVLGFPMPVPIFYEHIMIDGQKMSASKGNVVYPADWLNVAPAELLKFFYNKRLMKTRSFSWSDLPKLYEDYHHHESVYFDEADVKSEKERNHMKRLYGMSQLKQPGKGFGIPFEFAAMISRTMEGDTQRIVSLLKKTGHVRKPLTRTDIDKITRYLDYAGTWAKKYGGDKYRFEISKNVPPEIRNRLSNEQRDALKKLRKVLEEKDLDEEQLYNEFWKISEKAGIKAPQLFEASYLVLLGTQRGPRLAQFILTIGKDKVADLLKKV